MGRAAGESAESPTGAQEHRLAVGAAGAGSALRRPFFVYLCMHAVENMKYTEMVRKGVSVNER